MKRREILLFLISIVFLSFFWVLFTIYHNSITSTIPQPLGMQISPITPRFQTAVIDELKERNRVVPFYQLESPTQVETSPAPTSLPITTLTPSPTIEENATDSGETTP